MGLPSGGGRAPGDGRASRDMRPIMARLSPVERALPVAGRRRPPPDPPFRADQVPRTFRFPVAPPRARVDRRAARPRPPHRRDLCHDPARHRPDNGTPGTPRATAPPARTFGPQGPTLGELSDAYLQDYHVRQFRSPSTARGRIAHLVAFFGRAARAAALTTYQIRQYQLARRAAGAATGTINRETSALHRMGTLAVHWGWLDTVPGFPDRLRENPPRQGFFEHPEYLAVRAHLPAPWQDILDLAYYSGWRKNEILGLTWDETRRGRRRHPALARPLEDLGGADSPDLTARLPRPSRDGGHAATPTARWSSTATASPSAAGVRRGAPPVRRPAYRPASSTTAAAPPPAT